MDSHGFTRQYEQDQLKITALTKVVEETKQVTEKLQVMASSVPDSFFYRSHNPLKPNVFVEVSLDDEEENELSN